MCGLTVKDLYKDCELLVEQGLGDKRIMITSDDEGNSFHTLFYSFTTSQEDINVFVELFDDCCGNDPTDVVILG